MKLNIEKYSFGLKTDERWKKIARKWSYIEYEEEAIGLMLKVAAFMKKDHIVAQDLELEIINFFLFHSHCRIESIRRKAQEILFGKVIPNWHSQKSPGSGSTHARICELLKTVPRFLVGAPFQEHVWNYLFFGIGFIMCGYKFPDPDNSDGCYEEVQSFFRIYVHTMINWGFSDALLGPKNQDGHRLMEKKRILEEYLDQRWDRSYMFSYITSEHFGSRLSKHKGAPENAYIQGKAFLALMEIRFRLQNEQLAPKPKGLFD